MSRSILSLVNHIRNIGNQQYPMYEFNLAGSIAENGFSSRIFYAAEKNWKLEADVETVSMVIDAGYRHCIQEIAAKKGFLRVELRKDGCSSEQMIVAEVGKPYRLLEHNLLANFSSNDGYLMTYRVKNHVLYDNFQLHKPKKARYIEDAIKLASSFALNIPYAELSVSNLYRNETKATCEAGYNMAYLNKNFSLSADFSFIIRLQWKPTVQVVWEKRQRNWPSNATYIFQDYTGYVIAKPSVAEKHNPQTTEFRYSFGLMERKLTSMQSAEQRRTYLIFKSLYYKMIVPLDKENLTSYLAKTIMLWTCEKFSPDNRTFWSNTAQGVRNTVIYLFTELKEACQTGHLPYFFIPEINLLENIAEATNGKELFGRVVRLIEDLIKNFDQTFASPALLQQQNKVAESLQEIRNGIALMTLRVNSFLTESSPIGMLGEIWLRKFQKNHRIIQDYQRIIQVLVRTGRNEMWNYHLDDCYFDMERRNSRIFSE